MISRLTASATIFAVFATAGIAYAAETQQRSATQRLAAPASMHTFTMPTVVVTGKRQPRS